MKADPLTQRTSTERHLYAGLGTKIAKFGISGGAAAALGIALLYVFTSWLSVWYLPASVVAFIISMGLHFFLQKLWVFIHREIDGVRIEFAKFSLAALINLVINSVCMYLLVSVIGVQYLIAQIIIRIGLAVMNYFAYEHLIFKTDHNG